MQFVITEEQQMMTDMVREFLAANCTTAELRVLAEVGKSHDAARWSTMVELGLPGALVGEEAGGLGLAPQDVIGLVAAAGAALLPEPLIETMGITLPTLERFGETTLLAAVMAGEAQVTLSHPAAPFAEGADSADAILIFEADRVLLCPADSATLTPQPGVDPLRRLFVVTPGPDARILSEGEAARTATDHAQEIGALFAAAQMLGIAQRAIDISVAYAGERTQFGKPIGSYQAVKHQLASAQVAVEFARPVLQAAVAMAGTTQDAYTRARISHAKYVCGRAAETAAQTAIQVHGGMGYSQEADVHFYIKRTLSLRNLWGTETLHRNRYAARLETLAIGPDTLFNQED